MNESRRTPREAQPAEPDVPRREARRPRAASAEPLGDEEAAGTRAWSPFDDDVPGGGAAGAAADWERLRRATGAAGPAGPPPPDSPPSLASLLAVLEALRGIVPRELERQFSALLRELLLTLRALIDWYLERLDDGPREQRVEDIPID